MISFAAPWALFGLAAAAIPILLHLLARREPPTVDFPAVRYLSATARAHQRRLTLQHWLLLVIRTLLVVALVLAAAGPRWPTARAGGHAPAGLVLVVDNSASAGVTTGGTPMLERLRRAAREVVAQATPDDALWLLTADGSVRRGDAGVVGAMLDSLPPSPWRLELGRAIGLAREVLGGEDKPGEVMVLTDLQASAVAAAPGAGPLVVARPSGSVSPNAGILAVETGPQPWTVNGGRVTVSLTAGDTASVPMTVALGDRPARQALGAVGRPVSLSLGSGGSGWQELRVELAPDELRLDDVWVGGVRLAPPAWVRWNPTDRYLAAACDVLVEGRRIIAGTAVTLGELGAGPSVVLPPADPARVGALNRSLAARGIPWRYGARVTRGAATDSTGLLGRQVVSLRHQLTPTTPEIDGVLVTADGEPWLVRSGNVVLVGSRFEPGWTGLPLSADFVPFLDALLNRVVSGQLTMLTAAPGDMVTLPDAVDAIAVLDQRFPVEGGAVWRPLATGLHFLLDRQDTVGVVAVNPDPRESLLARADDDRVRALWSEARIVDLEEAGTVAFAAAGRGDLRGPLIALALLLALMENALASWHRRTA
jgi:hypothetical protein